MIAQQSRPMARSEEGAYREYATDERRRQRARGQARGIKTSRSKD
jgi:hypothetical protein